MNDNFLICQPVLINLLGYDFFVFCLTSWESSFRCLRLSARPVSFGSIAEPNAADSGFLAEPKQDSEWVRFENSSFGCPSGRNSFFFRLRIFRSSLWKTLFPTVLSIAARSRNDEKYNKRSRKSGAVSSAQSRMTAADTSAPLDECRFESTDMTEIWNNLRQLDSIKDNGLIMPTSALLWKLSRRGLAPGVILRFTRNSSQQSAMQTSLRQNDFTDSVCPRLLNIKSEFTAVELTQAASFIERVYEKATDFWNSSSWEGWLNFYPFLVGAF